MKFFKYQSLGNDFILLDWLKKPSLLINKNLSSDNWQEFVKNSCRRNLGVGADGLLLLIQNKDLATPETFIFNSNGEEAEVCFNGIRCIALHIFNYHNHSQKFALLMGNKKIECNVNISKGNRIEITTKIEKALSIQDKTINIACVGEFSGHVIDVGNPHFVVLKKTNSAWLKEKGALFERHKAFPNKTNTEFVWQEKDKPLFNMLIYERGCGLTSACSSGAASVLSTLHKIKKIEKHEKIEIKMEGGTLRTWLDKDLNIYQQAPARMVFEGHLTQIS